jgi:GNAT superfamily N-acetyltransferase
MEVIRTSQILKMLTIPSLGTYSNGRKFFDANSKCFVKQNGKYKLQPLHFGFTMFLNYETDDWVVQVCESEDYKNIYLAGIYAFQKGKGVGTDVMNTILDYCDENGYKLYLHPFPPEYSKERLNQKKALLRFYKLRDWYLSFGFVEQEDGYMVYTPINT